MKNLSQYIQEKLIIKKNRNVINYKYFPKTKKELREIIEQRIKQEGTEVDLNDIDVSEITDMSELFMDLDFNGDISLWDVSNVKYMQNMFLKCESFNQDISYWDVSNVENMNSMFYDCGEFNVDISSWNVSKVINMSGMFWRCKSFNQDLSSWDVSNVTFMSSMFTGCPIKDKYKPNFDN